MFALWIMAILLCLLIATGSALLALRFHARVLDRTNREREAWQQAQESRQLTWEVRQGKHIVEAEKKLADQIKEARREWRAWSIETEQRHQDWQERSEVEPEMARLPHVEQLELSHYPGDQRQRPKNWRPPRLYRADLNGRDLSYRYMEHADLREAQLVEANFHMSDLSGASLTGADLGRANLTGANLSGVDLRNANLAGANLLVADLHRAILHGANLEGARNLTPEQLQTAIYDDSTIHDSAISRPPVHQDMSSREMSTVSTPVTLDAADQAVPILEISLDETLGRLPIAQVLSETQQTPGMLDGVKVAEMPTAPLSALPVTSRKRRRSGEKKKASGSEKKPTGMEKSVEETRKIIQLPTRTSQTIPLSMLGSPKRAQRPSGALSLNLEMAQELENAESQQQSPAEGQNVG